MFNVGIHKVGTHFGGDFYAGGSKCRQFQKVGGFKMAVVQIGSSGNNVGSYNNIVEHCMLMEAADYDTHGNTGRKRNSEAYKARVKSIVTAGGGLSAANRS